MVPIVQQISSQSVPQAGSPPIRQVTQVQASASLSLEQIVNVSKIVLQELCTRERITSFQEVVFRAHYFLQLMSSASPASPLIIEQAIAIVQQQFQMALQQQLPPPPAPSILTAAAALRNSQMSQAASFSVPQPVAAAVQFQQQLPPPPAPPVLTVAAALRYNAQMSQAASFSAPPTPATRSQNSASFASSVSGSVVQGVQSSAEPEEDEYEELQHVITSAENDPNLRSESEPSGRQQDEWFRSFILQERPQSSRDQWAP